MKKFVLWLFYAVLALFLVFVAGGFVLPDKAHVSRSTVINAPPEKIFPVVSDLRRAKDWSPWFALDPQMTVTYEGDAPGVGQKMSWSSQNPNVGIGSQQTTGYVENQQVVTALDFGEMGQATASIKLEPEGTATKVTWDFDTTLRNIIERWFGLMFDRWIGADYEKGLANLKTHVEAN